MTDRTAIYCRISEDPRATEKGVARQREDCEALVAARGWQLVGVYTDNDISALKGAHRPGYAALLVSVQRGELDRIVAYGLSRLWRSRTERAEAIGVLSAARVGVALVKGSDLDLTSAAGRMYAGVLGEFDTAESEIKAERVARAAQQRAEEGRPNGALGYGGVECTSGTTPGASRPRAMSRIQRRPTLCAVSWRTFWPVRRSRP